MQSTEHEERIILALAHFRSGDFQVSENLLLRGLGRVGQGRFGPRAWSELRPVDAKSVPITRSFGRQRMNTKVCGCA
jgi:hypothetical protein